MFRFCLMYWYCNGEFIKNTERGNPFGESYIEFGKIGRGVKESKGLITQVNRSILIIAIKYLCESPAKPKWVFIASQQPQWNRTWKGRSDHPVKVKSPGSTAPAKRSLEIIDRTEKEKNWITKRVTRDPQANRDEPQPMIFMKIFLLNQM